MRKAANPFRFGAVVSGPAFTDRTREAAELRRDIEAGQDVVLLAPRRFGKTSLAAHVIDEARRDGARIGYVDLDRASSKEQLADALARTIYRDVDTGPAGLLERARDFASRLRVRPRLEIEPDGVGFTFDATAAPADLDEAIDQLLAIPGEVRAAHDVPVALVFDEFQEVVRLDAHYPRRFRSVFQTQPDVAHVYLGSRRDMLARLFTRANEPFYRSARAAELGPIADADLTGFLRDRFAATGKAIGDEAVAALLAAGSGWPYAVQELAYFTWDETAPAGAADAATFARGLERTLDAEMSHYTAVWQALSGPQRVLLEALAAESPARILTADYRRRHRLPATSSVQRAAGALLARELVRQAGRGVYELVDPLLGPWLRRERAR